jgi:hypothetical protein
MYVIIPDDYLESELQKRYLTLMIGEPLKMFVL